MINQMLSSIGSQREYILPLRTISEANCTEHWTRKHKRHSLQKFITRILLKDPILEVKLPCSVTIIRYGKKTMDSDNLQTSLKYIRDAIADLLIPDLSIGMADSDERISWKYEQVVSKTYKVGVIFS